MYTFTISFQIYSKNVMEYMSFLFLFYIKTLIFATKRVSHNLYYELYVHASWSPLHNFKIHCHKLPQTDLRTKSKLADNYMWINIEVLKILYVALNCLSKRVKVRYLLYRCREKIYKKEGIVHKWKFYFDLKRNWNLLFC